MTTVIDKFGRIVIPKQMRDNLGLRAGSEVELEQTPDRRIILKPKHELPLLVREGGLLVYGGKWMGPLRDFVADDRAARDRKNWGLPEK